MVGAHVEELAPRRLVRWEDSAALAVLVIVALLLHGWLLRHTLTTARDGIRFARTALHLESPNYRGDRSFADVLRDAKDCPDPPGFPLAVLACAQVVRAVVQAPVPEQMLLSAQVASVIAGVMLVFPSYWLGRMLFASAWAGFAGALLFQTLPTVAHISSDALADSTSLLMALCSLVCGVRAVRTWSTFWFLLTGVAAGCGYLVRPEGLVGVPAVAVVLMFGVLSGRRGVGAALSRGFAMLVGLLLIASPYMALIGGVSNKPTVNEQIRKLLPARLLIGAVPSPQPRVALTAEWYGGQEPQWQWALRAIVKETIKSGHYAVPLLGLVGLLSIWRRLEWGHGVVLASGVIQAGVLLLLAMKPMPAELGPGIEAIPPYVSERHTLLLVHIACLYCGGWLASGVMHRTLAGLVLAGLVAAGLPGALKPLHENRAGHLHAGRFLAGKIAAGEAVIDPFEWAMWYSGHSLYGIPADPPPEALRARWVVWEPTAGTKQNPHSRLPRLEAARNVVLDQANPPVAVYWWPEEVAGPEQARVVVYRQALK